MSKNVGKTFDIPPVLESSEFGRRHDRSKALCFSMQSDDIMIEFDPIWRHVTEASHVITFAENLQPISMQYRAHIRPRVKRL